MHTIVGCAALLPFLIPATTQDPGRPVDLTVDLTVNDVVLKHFTPQFAPAEHLHDLAQQIAGSERTIHEVQGTEYHHVSNLFAFGDSVMLYDTPEAVASLSAMLTKLDLAYRASNHEDAVVSVPIRHLSQDRLSELIPTFFDGQYTYIAERSTVLLNGWVEDTTRVKTIIEDLDQPAPQVLLSCYLVRGTNDVGADDKRIPLELAKHLSPLLSYNSLQLYSRAVLRTAAHPATGHIELWMEPEAAERSGVLQLSPGSFDAESGTLTLDRCTFGFAYEGDDPSIVFTTSTSIRSGEFTVLGATGMAPMFVVLRFELL